MKNLMLFVHPSKDFLEEYKTSIKIQIDNSLSLGWKAEDIILATNFPYEYNGVKSLLVSVDNYCAFHPQASNINIIIDLFKQKLITKRGIYWYHGFSEYQLNEITESELELDKADMFLPDFGRLPRWSSGSIFFKNSARDIFNWIRDILYKYEIDEESALDILTRHTAWVKGITYEDLPEIKYINKRIRRANITYNFHRFNVDSNYATALKPIRVVQFHFMDKPIIDGNPKPNQIDFFMYGKNKINTVLIPERLIKIFNKHGIK